jgi:glycerophosphoryl diester phosphodiesterase
MKPLRLAALERLGRPMLWGHRGCRSGAPENTLAAIDAAAHAGADGVEIDARICRSGELAVIHDPTLERVTNGADRRSVAELCYRDLARVDLGAGQRVARLEQVLELCLRRALALNVELKATPASRTRLAVAAARLLNAHDVTHPVVVSSFDPYALARFRLAAPTFPVALLIDGSRRFGWWPTLGPALGVHAVHPEASLVTPTRVRFWHQLGLRVHTWTVNAPTEADALIAAGVDGIITDLPATLRPHMLPVPAR